MRIFTRVRLVVGIAALVACSTASAEPRVFTWTGDGDGMTWEDEENWTPEGVPDADEDVVILDGVTVPIKSDGSRAAILTFEELRVTNSFGLDFDFEASGTGMRIIQKAGRPAFKIANSTVTFDAAIDLQTVAGDDTIRFDLGTTQPFGSTNLTFSQLINTNDNNALLFNPTLNSVLVRLNEDFAVGNGDMSIDGTMSVGVDTSLTANDLFFAYGTASLINSTSQLKANTVSLDGGSLTVKGDTPPTNPLPDLTNNINSSGGSITVTAGSVDFPQGVDLGRGNTIFNLLPTGAVKAEFLAGLSRQQLGATVSVLANPTASVEFTSVEGADANGVIPYATYNNNDFARYDSTTDRLFHVANYVALFSAQPGDAAQASGGVTLTGDKDVSVLKLNNAVVNSGGNALTTDGIMVKGVNASLTNMTVMPHDQPGTGPNELFIHANLGGDRFTTTNVDIADNNEPTSATFNAPQGGRWTVNDTFSYTGETNITSGTLILNGSGAGLGSGDVYLGPGSLLRLVNNFFTQNVTLGTGPFPAKIEADDNSTIGGDITIEVNTRNDRAVKLAAPQASDTLTITGTVTRGGTGNPIEGQGKAIVQLGESFGDGVIIIGAGADLSDPNLDIVLNGDGGREIQVNGRLGSTRIAGDVVITSAERGSIPEQDAILQEIMEDVADAAFDRVFGISPGQSFGTITVINDVLVQDSTFTYRAEVDDAGDSDLIAVGGTFDISTPNDTLDISFFSGTNLANADYTLATYGSLVGIFDSVIFDGTPVANPLLAGAIGGTHRLLYGANSLLLTNAAALPGDFDFDSDVDGRDFLMWQRGNSPNPVDGGDLADWKANYGTGPLVAATTTVPEPSTWHLLSLLLAAFVRQKY